MNTIWIYLFFAIITLSTSLFSSQIIKTEKVDIYIIETVKISDHTYIHFRNNWSSYDSHMWHDPECENCKQKINESLGKISTKEKK